MRRWIYWGLLIIFLLVFLISGWRLLDYYIQSKKAKDTYDELAQIVEQVRQQQPTVPQATDEAGQPVEQPPEVIYAEVTDPKTGEKRQVLAEYAPIYELNSDLVGWIYIDGTRINYPVMQNKEQTDYYLKRDFYKKSSIDGSIYVREECDVFAPSDNLTIYGHRMNSGAMFADLLNYKEEDFWQNNRYIHFDTLQEHHTYEIIAAFKISASADNGFQYHTFVDAADQADFDRYVQQCKDRAFYDTGVTAQYGDKLITLSTCEKGNSAMRIVVVAKRMD